MSNNWNMVMETVLFILFVFGISCHVFMFQMKEVFIYNNTYVINIMKWSIFDFLYFFID